MEFILEMLGITKDYPGVRALDGIDFQLRRGEIHALVGENGAGKSTLVKILSGAERKDAGRIVFEGRPVEIADPRMAEELGISVIYQEFNLIPYLNVAENIFLGHEPRHGVFLDARLLYAKAEEILDQLGVEFDLKARVKGLSVAQQQMVEIAKAISVNARVIVMDEPSATLTPHELERLFALTRRLRSQGVSIIYISHRLEEIFDIADRVTVLRDGRWIMTEEMGRVTRSVLIKAMVGRELRDDYPARKSSPGPELLRVEGLTRRGVLHEIGFSLRRGEILGLTGLVGAGRTELVRALFGADPIDAGAIYLEGKRLRIASPRDAIASGISLATEDRKAQGLVLSLPVRANVTMANLRAVCRMGFIDRPGERRAAEQQVNQLRIKTPTIEQRVRNLSGGNQQKVVLAKWLFARSKAVIFDEPTRGIDVGAKQEIYQLMNELAEMGVGVIMVSSELPEVIGMSDRILVMKDGRITKELMKGEADQELIMHYATYNGTTVISGKSREEGADSGGNG